MVCRPFWNMRRPGGGGAGPLSPGGRRASAVASSRPAIAPSSLENGRWNTTPGGWTVIDVTAGRVLRGRYATVTDVTRADAAPGVDVSTAFHCRNLAAGLLIGSPSLLL